MAPPKGSTRQQISMSDFVVTDDVPPPAQRGRGASSEWSNIIDALAETPGKWMKSKVLVSSSTASNLRKRAKNGLTPPIEVRMVDVDQKTGRGIMYLRVVPTK